MKLKAIWFYDEVYKSNILFVIGPQAEASEYAKKQYNINLEFVGTEGGRTFEVPSFGVIIWMPHFKRTSKDFGVLTHEIIHASLYTMDGKLNIDAENCEPFNYHCEWMMRKFLQLYKKLNN